MNKTEKRGERALAAKKTGTEAWKALILKLPSIIGAEICTSDSGTVTEIHVLADTGRAPKQIVRDIQSAVMAKFKTEIDHKIISIAQIPASAAAAMSPRQRIKLSGLDITYRTAGCTITVRLERDGGQFAGSANSDNTRASRYRAICTATAEAINGALEQRASVSAEDVRITEIGGQNAVMVSMALRSQGRAETLIGVCAEDDTGGLSAAKAALDAINRRISLIL